MFSPARVGVLTALVVLTVLALLWVTEAVPRDQIEAIAPKALAALAILVVAGLVGSALRGNADAPDSTDKPVP